MPTAPLPLDPAATATTGGELAVTAAAAPGPDGDAPVGSARTWRVACVGCGRRGYRLLERHPQGLVPTSARRCACGSARFEPLAPRARRPPPGDPPGTHRSDPAAPPASAGDHTPLAEPAAGASLQAPSFAQHLDGARSWAGNALAPSTRVAYARAWRHFRTWCARHDRPSLPADAATLAAYLDAHTRPRRYQTTTIQLRLAAIGHVHRLAGVADPTADEQVRVVWKGIRRDPDAPAVSPAEAATGRVLRQVLAAFPDAALLAADAGGDGQADDATAGAPAAGDLRERALDDLRDRALLALLLTAGLRSAELVGLNVDDVRDTEEGLRLRVRRSKTDQEGKSRTVGLPYAADPGACPVRGWHAWLERLQRAQLERGETPDPSDPAFRPIDRWGHLGPARLTTRGVRDLLARRFAAAGLVDGFSPHSLRRGFATGARQGGADLVAIMRHGGWKSAQTITRYIEEADLFRDNPAGRLGL
jgi:site-specific recombinase XerD